MKNIKKIIILSSVSLVSIALGMLIFRNNWFPISTYRAYKNELKHPVAFYLHYKKGNPIFSDRLYYDKKGLDEFNGMHIIQLPRHFNHPINLVLSKPSKIYRLLSLSNNNSIFNDWKKSDLKVEIEGASCKHTIIVYKNFPKGKIELQSGGPVAFSPIIIEENMASIILNGKVLTDEFGLTKINDVQLEQ